MKASKIWHCSCCDETINPGDEFKIIDGDILKIDHSMIGLDRPRNTEREANPETDFMKSHFVVCHVTEPERDVSKLFEKPLEQIEKRINRIKAEQASLDLDVKRAWNKYQRELPEQESIHDLPLFNIEAQHTEQLSLF